MSLSVSNMVSPLGDSLGAAWTQESTLKSARDYDQRRLNTLARLAKFPKVSTSPLGDEIRALDAKFKEWYEGARKGGLIPGTGPNAVPWAVYEKRGYQMYLDFGKLSAKILDEARKLGDEGVKGASTSDAGTENPLAPPDGGTDWTTYAMYGGIALVVLGGAYVFLSKRKAAPAPAALPPASVAGIFLKPKKSSKRRRRR